MALAAASRHARCKTRGRSRGAAAARPTDLGHVASGSRVLHGLRPLQRATQTVFGEGSATARMVLVGEQPGHEEDLAGRLLDEALEQAGVEKRSVYITNAVKHFKWKGEESGKRRIHDKPRQDEVEACRPWFDKELGVIKPEVLVCLGATAAGAVMGRGTTIKSARGRTLVSPSGIRTFVTVHPSAILRMPDRAVRQEEMRRFVGDLRRAAHALS